MNDYIAELTLDLDCRNTLPAIRAGQYDKERKCLIHITANDQPYSASGCTVAIKGRRQDKSYFSESCSVDTNGNVILTLSESTLAVRGFAYAKIVLFDATRSYSTQVFVIDVDSSLEGDVTEVDSFSILNDCLNQLAALFGLDNAQQILAQYLTTEDIISNASQSGSNKVFSSSFVLENTARRKSISYNDLDTAVEDGIIYRVSFDYQTFYMLCVSSRTNYRAQYRFDDYGYVKYRTQIKQNDEWQAWSDWSAIASTQNIAPGAVTTAKINDYAVNTAKLAAKAVTTDKLDNGAVTADKIAPGVIPVVPTNVSAFTNDAGYLTQHQDITGKMDIPSTALSSDDTSGVAMGQIFKYNDEFYIKTSSATPVGAQFKIENAKNKVTSLSSSSTNDEYASAKCVYDMIGDVESLLAAI